MKKTDRIKNEIAKLKKKLALHDPCAENNLACIYRKLGNNTRAFFWWKRAAQTWANGDALLEIAYCYQYGIGVRLSKKNANQNYWKAIHSIHITEYGCEEAKYHLAIVFLDGGKSDFIKRKAKKLLKEAASNGDYPQASALLQQLEKKTEEQLCRCRRGLRRSLGGKSQCHLHRPRKRLQSSR